jgi:hypothetical protein
MHGGSALGAKLTEELRASMATTRAELSGMEKTLEKEEDASGVPKVLHPVPGGKTRAGYELEEEEAAARPHLRTIAAAQQRISAQLQSFLTKGIGSLQDDNYGDF